MTLREHLPRLARALKRAFDEHGQPNAFSPFEVQVYHSGPDALIQGRIGRDIFLVADLAGELAKLGWTGGTKPLYDAKTRMWVA